jgi:NAD(P)-dependent dehydrogenase (short-subunit alcohol dehydrogenase family)
VIDEAIQACIANFGAMTHLISCIGTMLPVDTIRQVDAGAFRKGFDINFFSVVRLVQKSLPHLDKSPIRPTIVIVTSGADEEVVSELAFLDKSPLQKHAAPSTQNPAR